MQLFRSRHGFATNSSSSHSIILLKNGAKLRDTADAMTGEFGWNFFTAATRETKALYFSCLIRDATNRMLPVPYMPKHPEAQAALWAAQKALAQEAIAAVMGKLPQGLVLTDEYDSADIDHQSVYDLPTTHDGTQLNVDFAKDLWEFLARDDVAILGGNDNTDEVHPDARMGEKVAPALPQDRRHDIRARREPWGWSVFDRSTGTRLHLGPGIAANTPATDVPEYGDTAGLELKGYPDKSSTPELVDVKITDFCPFGCTYCYQGSTPAGKHADEDAVRRIAEKLRGLQVWEVALGGGEPTMHPRFLDILASFAENHVVPNFTTRSTKWLEDPIRLHRIMSLVGGVAFSVDTAEDVTRFAAALDTAGGGTAPSGPSGPPRSLWTNGASPYLGGDGRSRISFQYVVGVGDENAFLSVARAVKNTGHRLTLLGYKTTGRGNSLKPYGYDWAAVLKDLGLYHVSIDTALAQNSRRMLAGVDPRSYFTQEGKHSCYIDAVAGTVGPSSYAPELMQALHWSEWDAKDKKGRTFDALWKEW